MYRTFFAGNSLTALPLFALALFLVFFFLVVFWVLAVKRPEDFEATAALPLEQPSHPAVKP